MSARTIPREDLQREYATPPCEFRIARWLDNHQVRNRIRRGIGEPAIVGFRVFAAGLIGLAGLAATIIMLGAAFQ